MAKRQLSQNQQRRVKNRHTNNLAKANDQTSAEHAAEGEVLHGVVITNFGRKALVEYTPVLDPNDTENSEENSGERQQILCHQRANLESIVTGDRVVWRKNEEVGVIESRQHRTTVLHRPDSYGNLKPVAANVTQMLITVAVEPEPHLNLIDRYIVAAENHGLTPVIVINKADLINPLQREIFDSIEEIYTPLNYQIIYVCAHDQSGFDELKKQLVDHVSIFAGQSGVGKSSLIKSLLPEQDIKVGELSELVAKGKHTTTHSCLYHFPWGGQCIDSPGIREFGLWHFEPAEILKGFIDIEDYAGSCRFRDCSHKNTPGCAITEAVETCAIHPARYESFSRILSGLDDVAIKTRKS